MFHSVRYHTRVRAEFLLLVVTVAANMLAFTLGEETGYSIENNRVLKLLAEADARRAAAASTQAGQAPSTSTPAPPLPSSPSLNFSLTAEYERIVREVKQLKSAILRMQQLSHLDEQILKCTASIKRNIDYKARQHWRNILYEVTHLYTQDTPWGGGDGDMDNEVEPEDQDELEDRKDEPAQAIEQEKSALLRRIVIGSYEGLRSNILPIVHFINFTKIISGFQPLLQEMRDYDHIYYGDEIFLIARLIRLWCGTDSRIYEELPLGIQYIDSHSVQLLNENNQGLLYYKPKAACRGRHCNNHELFVFHQSVHDFENEEKDKTTWIFVPTNTTDSPWHTRLRFYIKNQFLEPDDNQNGNDTGMSMSVNATQRQRNYVNIDYEYRMSPDKRSIVVVSLVNHTEDAVRIRVEQSHLVKRLIMGTKNPGGSTLSMLSIMGTEDRFETANYGNWVVLPIEKLNATVLKDKIFWNKDVHCSI